MAILPKVAIAGATGSSGPFIVKELLEAGYTVVVLTRKASSRIPKHARVIVKEVDYTSVPSLVEALNGVDVVISNLNVSETDVQTPLIDASVAAGVSRYLPSEFGNDVSLPSNAKLPVFKHKAISREYVEAIAKQNPRFSYTYVLNAPFLDWSISNGFIINPKEHSATLFNGGEIPFSATRLSTVGKAVVGVMKHLDETKNKAIEVHDGVFTQKQLIEAFKRVDGQEWTTKFEDSADLEKWSWEQLSKPDGDIMGAMVGFIHVAIFAEGHGAVFKTTWNQKFGIPIMDESTLDEMVREIVQGS